MTSVPYTPWSPAGTDFETGEPVRMHGKSRWPPDSNLFRRIFRGDVIRDIPGDPDRLHRYELLKPVHTNDTNVFFDPVFTMFFQSRITGKVYLGSAAMNVSLGVSAEDDIPAAELIGCRFNPPKTTW